MEKGTLVEFRLNGERRLGVVDRPDGKKNWFVQDERQQSQSLAPRQITFTLAGTALKPTEITQFRQSVQTYLDPDALEVAWELLIADNATTHPQPLAKLLFSEETPISIYAAYLLLSEDKLYFKQKGDVYEPRSATQVADLKHQQQMAQQRQLEWQAFLTLIQERLSQPLDVRDPQSSSTATFRQQLATYHQRLDVLERFATLGEEALHTTAALEILTAVQYPQTSKGCFQLLVDLGLWSAHENVFLRRASIPTQFASKVLDVVQQCLEKPLPDANQRLDLSHLKVYTIDDESTTEIDDGLSVETVADGYHRLWIHIADPTRWLTPGDVLDLEARRRSTTLYLPTGMIPMFPSELATGPMSLVQGQLCCALSFGVVLDDEGAIADYSIHASLIKPTYRLTYDDVDEMLELGIEAEAELMLLASLAKRRYQWRQSQGAISIQMPEASIKVRDQDITIELLDNTASRQLVAEMMILAGEAAGQYGQTHQIPLPFRSQPVPELPSQDELLQLPAGLVRECAIRRCMPRSEISVQPGRHTSLGLDGYVQVTSPIRRYSDLLAHFQIKAHLRGATFPFSLNEMQELIQGLSTAVQEAVLVERQTNRYWGLEYLRRQSEQVWRVMLLRWLREHEGLGLILIEDLGLELAMRFNNPINLGDRLDVRVTYADPRQDVIQLEPFAKPAEASRST
jgi:exoribonuclease II